MSARTEYPPIWVAGYRISPRRDAGPELGLALSASRI
jgi:hypothetical protein